MHLTALQSSEAISAEKSLPAIQRLDLQKARLAAIMLSTQFSFCFPKGDAFLSDSKITSSFF